MIISASEEQDHFQCLSGFDKIPASNLLYLFTLTEFLSWFVWSLDPMRSIDKNLSTSLNKGVNFFNENMLHTLLLNRWPLMPLCVCSFTIISPGHLLAAGGVLTHTVCSQAYRCSLCVIQLKNLVKGFVVIYNCLNKNRLLSCGYSVMNLWYSSANCL